MSTTSSVTLWLEAARNGDDVAIEKLWKRFSGRMTGLAKKWLTGVAETFVFDEDDVTVSAFEAFHRAITDGRYKSLKGSDQLWRLLAKITIRKASDRAEAELADKRGGQANIVSLQDLQDIAQEPSAFDPSPELAAQMSEECGRLLALLEDPELEAVALYRLYGYKTEEIAKQMDYSRRTINRMLKVIRLRWADELDGDE